MPKVRLTPREEELKFGLVQAIEALMGSDAESVGRIADHVGEHGADSGGGRLVDTAVTECLRHIVDNIVLVGHL